MELGRDYRASPCRVGKGAHAVNSTHAPSVRKRAVPTRSNLRRHPHPREAFLLDDGELPSLVGDLEVVSYEEGWLDEGRHEARLVARRR